MYKQLDSAIAFAATAHAGQVRKYDGLPYIVHPLRVMTILHETAAIVTEDQLVASVLHDVVEDTVVRIEAIERRFGPVVASLVFDLTDQFVDPALGNRKHRKDMERDRLSHVSAMAQDIKLADLIDNTASIAACDPGFARTYLREKELLLEVMIAGDRALYDRALASLRWGQSQLVQHALEKKNVNSRPRRPGSVPPDAAAGVDRQPHGLGPVPGLGGVASIAR